MTRTGRSALVALVPLAAQNQWQGPADDGVGALGQAA
jgi:hypothetical protein